MRLKRSRLRTLKIANKSITKDSEGVPQDVYGTPSIFDGTVWPAGGKLQVEKYGDKISSILNCKLDGDYTIEPEENHIKYVFGNFSIREGDGVYIYSDDKPDYRIISITPYKPLKMEVERL